MKIQSIRTKLYQWQGPVKTSYTFFATPLSALPFQNDAQAPFRFFSWLSVAINGRPTDGHGTCYGQNGTTLLTVVNIISQKQGE